MRVLVTGAAGFIGSRLCARLLSDGAAVTGVDCFTEYYPRWIKERNVAPLLRNKRFTLVRSDLNDLPLRKTLRNVEAVFHLAAQAGVRASWGRSFPDYVRHNIQATQNLLEAAKDRAAPGSFRFVILGLRDDSGPPDDRSERGPASSPYG
jgi:UDP-glucose 4-epimerase